jgi:hypothetical protein
MTTLSVLNEDPEPVTRNGDESTIERRMSSSAIESVLMTLFAEHDRTERLSHQ